MDLASILGLTVENMKVCGEMENNMEKEGTYCPQVSQGWGIGKKAKDCIGKMRHNNEQYELYFNF